MCSSIAKTIHIHDSYQGSRPPYGVYDPDWDRRRDGWHWWEGFSSLLVRKAGMRKALMLTDSVFIVTVTVSALSWRSCATRARRSRWWCGSAATSTFRPSRRCATASTKPRRRRRSTPSSSSTCRTSSKWTSPHSRQALDELMGHTQTYKTR